MFKVTMELATFIHEEEQTKKIYSASKRTVVFSQYIYIYLLDNLSVDVFFCVSVCFLYNLTIVILSK